jgi:hypothetical protein
LDKPKIVLLDPGGREQEQLTLQHQDRFAPNLPQMSGAPFGNTQ